MPDTDKTPITEMVQRERDRRKHLPSKEQETDMDREAAKVRRRRGEGRAVKAGRMK